ncbi:hypothetical protein AAEX37_00964 [Oligella sp. MSHR50489EDL]|uniref:DUF2946 family protein n=1 Tax=Oligella sp. MSHR50489EDL TaxID=3139409 RepID=UPI003D81765E
MDQQVLAAMEKWPNVPAEYGWLSLNARGLWRFHHGGDFQADPEGDSIENSQLIAFFGRNYCVNERGEWYIQNGPQKAYLNLPHAPFILFYDDAERRLSTHHEHTVKAVRHWYFSDDGRVFAQTDIGPAMLIGRDVPTFIEQISVIVEDATSRPFTEADFAAIAAGQELTLCLATINGNLSAPCRSLESDKAEQTLGFVSFPKP